MPLPVFYTPMSVVASPLTPSAYKPHMVVEGWKAIYGKFIEVLEHPAASAASICLAHDPQYVQSILSGSRESGLGMVSRKAAQALSYTNGGVMFAAEHVLTKVDVKTQYPIACAPYAGFHHAHYDRPSGYCTFNGLVIAALAMVKADMAEQVLILDCDQHYGDGTQSILDNLNDDDTGFIHHWSAGKYYDSPKDATNFLKELPQHLAPYKNVDLVLYQAGADQHRDDPLGGFLGSRQMRKRDKIVFETIGDWGAACVWTLAGGYQDPFEKVLKLHNGTLEQALITFNT